MPYLHLFSGGHSVRNFPHKPALLLAKQSCKSYHRFSHTRFLGGRISQIRRPNNYDPGVAIMLGPTDPNPAMDLTGFDVVRTVVQDSPHKVFLGGLPCDWTEDQVKEMLVPYGHLKAFNLVMDRATGNSKVRA